MSQQTEQLVPASILLQGYDAMLQAASIISVDVEQADSIMPIIMKIQNFVRKYQRKDKDELISGWIEESKSVDADILEIVSFLTIHPDSVGTAGLDLCSLRRSMVDIYRRFSEPVHMYLAKEAIMGALRDKGFDGELTFEKSDIGPDGDLLRVRMESTDIEPAKPKTTPKRKVH